jgi:hypothetical protein
MGDKEQFQVSEDLNREADNIWNDPQKIMRLIDLLFLWDDKEQIPS